MRNRLQSLKDHVSRNSIESLILIFLFLGIGYRLVRWIVGMPLWGDEVMFAINFLGRDAGAIFEPLEFSQVAPPFFMLYSWVVITKIGVSEIVLRLLPMVSGVIAFVVFARVAKNQLSRHESLVAIAILGVSYYTVRHGAEFKPYASDLLFAVLILWVTLRFRSKANTFNSTLYALIVSTTVLFSYSSIFVSTSTVSPI